MRSAKRSTRSLQLLDEAVDAIVFDLALVGEAELFLDLDLDPQSLAIEAVLVALAIAAHGVEALKEVFVGAAPGVVNAHRIVGGDRPVDERPAFLAVFVALSDTSSGCRAHPTAAGHHAPAAG